MPSKHSTKFARVIKTGGYLLDGEKINGGAVQHCPLPRVGRHFSPAGSSPASDPFILMEEIMKKEKMSKYKIVRTYSAGVFLGLVVSRKGQEVKLKDARRLWYWDGAASLSQLATTGTVKPSLCKFPAPVSENVILWGKGSGKGL